jgi:hypothetical protein
MERGAYLEELGINEGIILKLIFRITEGCELNPSGSGQEPIAGLSKNGDELCGCIRGGEFLE